jgi:hypothetical protein
MGNCQRDGLWGLRPAPIVLERRQDERGASVWLGPRVSKRKVTSDMGTPSVSRPVSDVDVPAGAVREISPGRRALSRPS